jgi:uncharacterized protein (DUF885 family)
MDDREFATKKLDLIYLANSKLNREEITYHIFNLLEKKTIKYHDCCTKLNIIDPNNSTRFLDVVYALYLYIHPNTATMSRCLKSTDGNKSFDEHYASRMIENRFTNKFSDSYIKDSSTLIVSVLAVLDPLFQSKEDVVAKDPGDGEVDNDTDNDTIGEKEKEKDNGKGVIDLRCIYEIIKIEKFKLDEQLTYYLNPLDSFEGPVMTMFETLENHQIESYADAFNFLERLKSIMIEIHRIIQYMEKQKSLMGVMIPRVVAKECHDSIKKMLEIDIHDVDFIKKFKIQIESIGMDHEIYDQAVQLTRDQIYRALYHLIEWINEFFLEEDECVDNKSESSESGNSGESKTNQPVKSDYSICCDENRGPTYYTYCLKHHTTTDMMAPEIHELGKREVDRISEFMIVSANNAKLADRAEQIGDTSDDEFIPVSCFKEAVEYIRTMSQNTHNIYTDDDAGEHEASQDVLKFDALIKERLDDLFLPGTLPRADCQYMFVPEHQKDISPAAYYSEPSFDGKKKGAFYMNLRSQLSKFGLPTLVAHEAIPGHHFQLSIVAESDIHPIRKIGFFIDLNAYVEGWALYTEKLGLDIGLYSTPQYMIGHLLDEMLRATRLVVDTGIHYYGWSREQAIDYMNDHCPFPFTTNRQEVDRYIRWPGQAVSYKIGQLQIMGLRDLRLGEGTSIQEFNTRIIGSGAVPINLIDMIA